jgi:hypothetical protein
MKRIEELDKIIKKYIFFKVRDEEVFLKKMVRIKKLSFAVLVLLVLVTLYNFLINKPIVDVLLGVIILLTVYYNCQILIILFKEKIKLMKLK